MGPHDLVGLAAVDLSDVMRCPGCHHENPGDAKFCLECGRRLAVACSACGTELPAGAKFCKECGAATGSSIKPDAPASYTPKHLAEKILNSKAALEGERKQVTVLFADLKGSMELLADRDPEEARKLLDPVLEHMMEAVHRYEGTVNQVMGDGIMALFGAPLAHEDHAVRASYAALRMQARVKKYAEGARRDHGVTIHIRVGLNSGEVVVREIGSDLRMDYTAVGQTTHLAARMEQLAEPGAILLTRATLALVEGFVQVADLGPMAVKGLPAPIEVYQLIGIGAARSRLQAAAARGLSRFVGRDAEIEQLSRAADQAQDGRGQVAAVVGGPGVGKSRLTFELTHSDRFGAWRILRAGAVSYGKSTSYLPVIDLLKSYFHIEDRDSAREIRDKVRARLLMLDPALEGTLPALLGLLDASDEDLQWQALDPRQRRQRTLDAIKQLLLREARTQPLLVILEDLHWIDSETQAVLDSLVDSLPPARLLLLVNYRPEYEHRWGSKTAYTQLRLDPLPRETAFELLHDHLGEDNTIGPLKQILTERTEGNPFFLEESVRALIETKALVGERGAYRLAGVLTDIQIPSTVQSILAARIDRLSPEDKHLLQSAAVIGKDVPFALLAALAEESEEDLRRGLARLQAAEFLYEVSLVPDLEYTFKHALTHEVAYGSLLQDRRRVLHRNIVAALERLYPGRLTEHTERLAHHAFRGETWDKSAVYALQAGRRAMDRSAALEACEYAEQGLAAVDRRAPGPEAFAMTLDLRVVLASALFPLGETERLLANSEAMLATAQRLGDRRRLVDATGRLANTLWQLGDNQRALPMAEHALREAVSIGDLRLQVVTGLDLGQVFRSIGDYRRAVDVLDRVMGLLASSLAKDRLDRTLFPFVVASSALSFCLSELGELQRAEVVASESARFAESIRHPGSLQTACAGAAHPLLVQGRFAEAMPNLERALEIARQSGLTGFQPMIAADLGLAYAGTARFTEALSLATDAAQRVPQMSPRAWGSVLARLAEIYALASKGEDARGTAQRAVEAARVLAQQGTEARGLYLLAEASATPLDRPDVHVVESGYREALGLAAGLGMRPLVAHCHLGLGKLYRRTGKREQAQKHLATATTMFREMGMTYWLAQAEAELHRL